MEDIEVVMVPDMAVLGIRKRGHYAIIPQLIMTVCMFAMEKGVAMTGPPIFVMHEQSREEAMTADQKGTADVEIAVPVAGKPEGEGEVRSYTLPGGRMARVVHKGPYEACEPTYNLLFAWIAEQKKTITGPMREVYLNDPHEVGPEEILTEIYAPIS
ncbi:MAG: GyrI-like domain-containing protein [Methanomicrobiaceae archaeon]|nr:GyrI-like domain-containing protein [Methanomicrobiaceae archaeon]